MAKLKGFEIWSAIGTIIFGSLLHFVFDWFGGWKLLALIAAVNESTWEHLKLTFWPAFIFSIIGYIALGREQKNFYFAQMAKLFLMPLLIVVLFYGWLAFFHDNFIYDISIFIVAVFVGHYIAYRLEIAQRDFDLKGIFLSVIVLLLLCFSLFTYYPPHSFLFRDPISGNYGIVG